MSAPTPIRLQRSRAKGSRLVSPNGLPVVCVTRGTKWGNPFRIFGENEFLHCDASHRRKILCPWVVFDHDQDFIATAAHAVEYFRRWLSGEFNAAGIVRPCTFSIEDIRRALGGKNLACWCKPNAVCHADILLQLANALPPPPPSGPARTGERGRE